MQTKIKIKHGLEASRNSVVPDVGEFLWTTDGHKLFMGDGKTAGGIDFVTDSINGSTGHFIPLTQKAKADGVATLDSTGKVPVSQMNAHVIENVYVVKTHAEKNALDSGAAQANGGIHSGDVCVVTDEHETYMANQDGANLEDHWTEILTVQNGIFSVNGLSGHSIDLQGDHIKLHGYQIATAGSPIIAGDTVDEAIGKLEFEVKDVKTIGTGTAAQVAKNKTAIATNTATLTTNTAKLANALLKDGSIKIDSAFTPSAPGDVVPFKTLDSFMGSDHPEITNINEITKVGIYHGGHTDPTDSTKNVKVIGTPVGDVDGACMIMASEDKNGNFGYFCMGDSGILYTGARAKGATSVTWASASLGTGLTILLDKYSKPAATGPVGATDSVQIAIGKLERGLEAAKAGGGDVNVQSDWNVGDNKSDAFIKNKPAIANDLTTTASGSILDARQGKILADQIKANKGVQADWNATTVDTGAIKNRPDLTVIDGGTF